MKILRNTTAGLIIAGMTALAGCSSYEGLKDDVQPVADAMCKFIGVENQIKTAAEAQDSIALDSLGKIRHQLQIEMTVLNQEFNQKYGKKFQDEGFQREYKKAMNDALMPCPHLSAHDREMMEEGKKQ
jgi:hypothetical protein